MRALARALAAQLGVECAAQPAKVAGKVERLGCYRWQCTGGAVFVKVVPAEAYAQLEAEALGLTELAGAGVLRVPRVRAQGVVGADAFLALEWIEAAEPTALSHGKLGEGLAALHHVCAERFGWHTDNTIGSTPQMNEWSKDWPTFWRERRLRPQLDLAIRRGWGALLEAPGRRLLELTASLLDGHCPEASLLHGDLWAGNWCADGNGSPVIFDPAVYYGDRETDLAMTRLFGGFGPAFYESYLSAAPLPAGHTVRADLYNLYHLLNHASLFGGGYAERALAVIRRLLAEAHN